MAETLQCKRCRRNAEALEAPPLPGAVGAEVHAQVCADCWAAWQQAEVMVINELKLNFMDPASQEVLERHMREFLALDPNP